MKKKKEEKRYLIFLLFATFYLTSIYVDGIKINWPLTPPLKGGGGERERERDCVYLLSPTLQFILVKIKRDMTIKNNNF